MAGRGSPAKQTREDCEQVCPSAFVSSYKDGNIWLDLRATVLSED